MSAVTASSGVSLSAAQAYALAADPELARRLDTVGLSRIVVGIDALRGVPVPRDEVIDAHVTISLLSAAITRTGLLAGTAPIRDHPYNIARRAGSLDLLTEQETGLVVGFSDGSVENGTLAWGIDGLGPAIPLSTASVEDAIAVIDQLWHAWPFSSILADRERRIFVDLDQVRPIDHEGVYRVRGPLGAPAAPQGFPLLAVYASDAREILAAHRAELLIVPEGAYADLVEAGDGEVATALAAPARDGRRLWIHRELSGPPTALAHGSSAASERLAASIDGVLLSLPDLTAAELVERLADDFARSHDHLDIERH